MNTIKCNGMTESLSKKVLKAGAKLETELEQRGFMKGIEFMSENIWHDADERPDPDKCVFAYNPEKDEYDFAYYEKVAEGYKWAYIEDFCTKDMYNAVLKHEKERDKIYY